MNTNDLVIALGVVCKLRDDEYNPTHLQSEKWGELVSTACVIKNELENEAKKYVTRPAMFTLEMSDE